MNNLMIAGNITKDCEERFLSNGDPVVSFSVADNQGKDKPAIYWNCSLFGKRASSLAQYLTRGQSVTVSGNVTERLWTDKEGKERKSMEIRVADVALQGGRKDDAQAAKPTAKPAQRISTPDSFDSEDIPF